MTAPDQKTRQRMEEAARRCAAAGRPLTIQRRAVLEALLVRTDHPTADQVYADVARRHPGLSRTTVYRSLETLVGLGLVARVGHPGVAVRYDPEIERHHHLVCEKCQSIEDVWGDVASIPLPPESDFQVRDYSVLVYGTCARCLAST